MLKKLIFIGLSLSATQLVAQENDVETLDKLLELRWVSQGLRYSSNPLVHHELIHETFGTKYALDAETGKKLYFVNSEHQKVIKGYTKDSVLYFSMRRGGSAIVNIYNGQLIYQSKIAASRPWIKRPRTVSDTLVYHALNDSVFSATSVIDGKSIWVKEMKGIYDVPVEKDQIIYVFDDEFLFELNKRTGEELDKIKLGRLGADPIVEDEILYAYIIDKGIVCYNLITKDLKWEYVDFDSFYKDYQLVNKSEKLFIVSRSLIALLKESGSLGWKNDKVGAGESFHLASTSKYILTYKIYDDQSKLVACDIETGKIAFDGFSRIEDKVGDKIITRPLEDLEYVSFRFGQEILRNLLYAVDPNGNIYCFEINE
ncbi:MAG: PQQ-binding-like beta-propeller repeat protein [Imperialibacter sp.]|uniref:outer membrane protein assembly factor BamB family protein n=1 Tax=Imperialibacter sp. TaxID=2038411 RepID=UPI0032EDB6A2